MVGKHYLLDLHRDGYPVIPTVGRRQDIERLPTAAQYVVKPERGADSVGLAIVELDQLQELSVDGLLIQPRIDFAYEVSFYFVGHTFQYALFAPDPARRWVLEPYAPTQDDLSFAQRFIDWNDIHHGIQRVDACRTQDGDLLLVELEDLNPYLSLDRVSPDVRESFIRDMAASLTALLR